MKTLYFECNMGAAGDMIVSALLELHPEPDSVIKRLNELGISGVSFKKSASVKCGITGTHVEVSVGGAVEDGHMHHHRHHHHHHTGMREIEHVIGRLNIPEKVREDAAGVYRLIAEAESHAHGCEISDIHFHEVGTMDAVADVVGACLLIYELNADRIIASPVNVGSGQVRCAHGVLPVPAPATAHILRGVPVYSGDVRAELCTPTGAAILKYFAEDFAPMPVMTISKIGYGMGSKDFETANCTRAMLGETRDKCDTVSELCCNLDDMTGEAIGFAAGILFEAGALDVFTTPVGMKKNRPGVMLTCICRENQREEMLKLIFKHTTTIGVREYTSRRFTLNRTQETVHTQYGDVRVKRSEGWGVSKAKAEYDDIEKIAKENNIAVSDIKLDL